MRELRTCPVTGQVVLVDALRVDSPAPPIAPPRPCPWCVPPAAVISHGAGVVAAPHPRPVLRVEARAEVRQTGAAVARDALGAHEVVLGAHDGDDAACLSLVQARMRDLRGDRRLRGFRAARAARPGHHLVWELWALPFEGAPGAPHRWRDAELAAGERVVARTEEAVAILAWAPRAPFETWILPRAGVAGFEEVDPAPVAALAARVLARVQAALGGAPVDLLVADGAPWRLELVPRLPDTTLFPVATAIPHHGGVPERVAEYLRATPEPA